MKFPGTATCILFILQVRRRVPDAGLLRWLLHNDLDPHQRDRPGVVPDQSPQKQTVCHRPQLENEQGRHCRRQCVSNLQWSYRSNTNFDLNE